MTHQPARHRIHTCCSPQGAPARHLQALHLSRGDTWEARTVEGLGHGSARNTNKGDSGRRGRACSRVCEGYALCLLAPSRWRFMSLITLPLTKPWTYHLTNTVGNVYQQKHHIIRAITHHPASMGRRPLPSLCRCLQLFVDKHTQRFQTESKFQEHLQCLSKGCIVMLIFYTRNNFHCESSDCFDAYLFIFVCP